MSERATNICSVRGCGNRLKPIFRFPNPKKHEARCRRWVTAVKNPNFKELSLEQIYKRGYMCSKHFEADDFIVGTRRLLPTAVPTRSLPSEVAMSGQPLTSASEDPSSSNSGRMEQTSEPEVQTESDGPLASSSPSGISIIDVREEESDLQMIQEAEILQNFNLFDAKFIDVPDTVASQPISFPLYNMEKHNSDEVTSDPNHITENENEKIQNLQIDQCNEEEEVVFDSEPFKLNVQENGENRNDPRTISGGKESSETSLTSTKPYFRSVKSYLKDCNRMAEVCRICFCSLDDKEVIKLYEDTPQNDSTQIKNMLKLVLPDLDLEIYPNTVICTKCVELLLYSYQLQEKWLHTEEKLQKIIKQKRGVLSSVADLVVIGKLLTDNNAQNFEDDLANDVYFGEPDFQEGTWKNMTDSILENLLQPSEKTAPVSVFYGELDLNDKNQNYIEQKAYQASEQKNKEILEKKKYGMGPFMCEQCGHMVMHFNSLRRHLISHKIPREKKKREPKFMCEICGQLFLSSNNLRNHASKHVEYTCSFCSRVFSHQFRLQDHIRCKHVRNCYQCHLCGKQVSYARSLKMHMLLHYPKLKLQACRICDKKFRYPCNLKRHLNSHVLDKSLRCEYCGRFLKHEISLRKHMRIYHMNQGKNVCEFCNKIYWKKCDLEKHRIRCRGGSATVKGSNDIQGRNVYK